MFEKKPEQTFPIPIPFISGNIGSSSPLLSRDDVPPPPVDPLRIETSVCAERLRPHAGSVTLRRMANSRKRPQRKRSSVVARPSELGPLLADLRTAKGLSLRQVEEATDKAVSNAYLSQLENGKIQKPSPNVLHSLAAIYAVPYEGLMEKAGYLLPREAAGSTRRARLAVFSIDDLTAEEEEELLKYLAFLRSRKSA